MFKIIHRTFKASDLLTFDIISVFDSFRYRKCKKHQLEVEISYSANELTTVYNL